MTAVSATGLSSPSVSAALCLMILALGCSPAFANDTILFAGHMNEEGIIVPPTANPGENATVEFFYADPTSNLQGFSLALCFDCTLVGVEGSYSILGTVLVTLGAEFVSQDVDNDPDDGDGCELIIGVLIDALPPFENQTLPPTLLPLKIGEFQFEIPLDTPCTSFAVEFCDGIDGTQSVPINNTVVIQNESVSPDGQISTEIVVPADSLFVRGEVNNDGNIDIADLVFMLAFLFSQGEVPTCLDAADTDDDGILTITDPLFLALYIFLQGLPPPAPFPVCGLEPLPDTDELTCLGPVALCPFCP